MYFEDIRNPFHFYDQLLVRHPCLKLQFNRNNTSLWNNDSCKNYEAQHGKTL